ncbi:hypothetical protein NLG97_g9313 [Lecanicillium saksenae]|uniref:Uncharacterized protein n=1 Tax=Lecanicillium saksenae TaxID=468837 RepID=A0ACC1QJR2_9HYPO|nr:hypothetical protein NLG97_g9313 [Lecanicillium saksenae]
MEKEPRPSSSPGADEAKIEHTLPQSQINDATSPAAVVDAPAAVPTHEPAPPLPESRRLPQWLDHFNRRDLTTLLRCVIAIWAASLLMIIHPSLHRLGQSAFLASVVLYIIPPAGNFIIAIVGYLSLLFGMCLAWAWSSGLPWSGPSCCRLPVVLALASAVAHGLIQVVDNDLCHALIQIVDEGRFWALIHALSWAVGHGSFLVMR